jgi:hypothetical protein
MFDEVRDLGFVGGLGGELGLGVWGVCVGWRVGSSFVCVIGRVVGFCGVEGNLVDYGIVNIWEDRYW